MDQKWSKSDFVQVEIKEGLWKVKIYSKGLLVRWGSRGGGVNDYFWRLLGTNGD